MPEFISETVRDRGNPFFSAQQFKNKNQSLFLSAKTYVSPVPQTVVIGKKIDLGNK